MSYQVIARKYRPQSFLELIGQEHVAKSLLNSLKEGRVPQALLFTGTRGVGKTSSARIFAKSLRCPNAVDFIPCNQCKECEDITSGSSVDIMEIDGASNNGVDAIRELRDSVSYMPASGKYKVYIIDEVHMLSNSAFNALLKTLEEPPAHVIFIFATTEPQKIPQTILSRCQRYDFKKVSTKQITDLLADICQKEGISFEGDALWFIAKQAQGSVRDAFSSLDLCISFNGKNLNEEGVGQILGITDRSLRMNLLKSLANREKDSLLDIIDAISQTSVDPKVFIQNLLEDLRNLIIVKMSKKPESTLLSVSESELNDLNSIAETLSEEEIHMLFDMALKGASDIQRAFEPKIVLEMIFLRMASAPKIDFFYPGESKNTKEVIEKKNFNINKEEPKKEIRLKTSIPKKEPTPAPARNVTPPKKIIKNTSELKNEWLDIITKIETTHPLLGSKLKHVALKEVIEQELHLVVDKEHEFLLSSLKEKENIDIIKDSLKKMSYPELRVQISKNSGTKVQSPQKIQEIQKQKQDDEMKMKIENSKLFMEAKKVFPVQSHQIREMK